MQITKYIVRVRYPINNSPRIYFALIICIYKMNEKFYLWLLIRVGNVYNGNKKNCNYKLFKKKSLSKDNSIVSYVNANFTGRFYRGIGTKPFTVCSATSSCNICLIYTRIRVCVRVCDVLINEMHATHTFLAPYTSLEGNTL